MTSWLPELAEHSRFFNNLVELIPARFYRDEEDRIDLYSLNKAEKKAAKEEFRTKAKLNKLVKLSGDNVVETNPSDDAPSSSGNPETAKHATALLNIPTGNASRDELQEKLHQRLLVGWMNGVLLAPRHAFTGLHGAACAMQLLFSF